jgi:Domain of unknown function (DUF4265)
VNPSKTRQEKIRVDLTGIAEDGWPPSTAEWLWADYLGDGLFRVDNIPIFARGISNGDIVKATKIGDHWEFERVIEHSPHSTFRVFLCNNKRLDEEPAIEWWEKLQDLGSTYEGYAGGPLFAIDVPTRAVVDAVKDVLKEAESQGIWEFEEGNVWSGD